MHLHLSTTIHPSTSTYLTLDMSPHATALNGSPLPRRLKAPLPPSPHRTTSQLSVVSVEAHTTDDHRPLLSQTVRSRSTSAPLSDRAPLHFGNTPSRVATKATASAGPSSRRNSGSGGVTTPSRKGKERAVGLEIGDIAGETTQLATIPTPNRSMVLAPNEEGQDGLFDADMETSQIQPIRMCTCRHG